MNNPRKIFREFNDEKLNQIRNHPYFAGNREQIIEDAERFLATDPPRIKFSDIHMYVTTGDRYIYQDKYYEYFDRMNVIFWAYLITEEEKYLTELADTIWNICNFESWAVPAHVDEKLSIGIRRSYLALFSTRAGRDIAEIIYFIGDKLPELVVRRAKAELQYRIIDAFASREHGFCKVKHNWASACASCVLCTYLYIATDEEIEAQLPRLMKAAENYLDGFQDDCCCQEGVSYWGFGFYSFLVFATMLRDYTDGRINYFDNPKVRKIAMFPYRVRLNERDSLTFSDSRGMGYRVMNSVAHTIRANYPDFPILDNEPTAKKLPYEIRGLFWVNPDYAGGKIALNNETFENVQWLVHHGKNYDLGAKAGHNDEFHNHNDVGSFIVAKDDVIAFCDPGIGAYSRQYFAAETRYQHLLCSSRGHSTPIINGEEQKEGNRGICDILELNEGRFTFDMKKAYVVDTLESLVRDFDCNDECFTLTDTYKFSEMPTALTERFVSCLPITLEGGMIKSGNSTLVFDTDKFDVNIASEDAHGEKLKTLYYVDFTPRSLDKNMSFTFKFM